MTISEKSAYLKGLMDGLNLDTEAAEGKMISAIVELLGDLTKKVTDIEDTTIAISDELDEIEEDLDAIEDFIMDEEDEWDEEDEEDSWDGWDEDDEEGFDFGDEDSTIYEVECACGEIINFDEETLEEGSIICPNCGETLEFTFEDEEEDFSLIVIILLLLHLTGSHRAPLKMHFRFDGERFWCRSRLKTEGILCVFRGFYTEELRQKIRRQSGNGFAVVT